MRVAVGIDHAGTPLRDTVFEAVRAGGHEPLDLGEHDDYPDTALDAGRAIAGGEADRAILICGSGAGVSVAANKLAGIRASVCHVRRLNKIFEMERDGMDESEASP